MKAFPVEFRHRVVALTDEGMSTSEIVEVLGCSGTWVRTIKALHRSGASLEPKSRVNTRASLAKREGGRIRAQVASKPGTTLEDLKRDLNLNTTIPNLWYALRDLKLRFKKKRSTPPSGIGPTSPPAGRSGTFSPPASTRAGSFSSTKPSAPRR